VPLWLCTVILDNGWPCKKHRLCSITVGIVHCQLSRRPGNGDSVASQSRSAERGQCCCAVLSRQWRFLVRRYLYPYNFTVGLFRWRLLVMHTWCHQAYQHLIRDMLPSWPTWLLHCVMASPRSGWICYKWSAGLLISSLRPANMRPRTKPTLKSSNTCKYEAKIYYNIHVCSSQGQVSNSTNKQINNIQTDRH